MEKIQQKIACTHITDTVKELIEIPSVTGEEGAYSDKAPSCQSILPRNCALWGQIRYVSRL